MKLSLFNIRWPVVLVAQKKLLDFLKVNLYNGGNVTQFWVILRNLGDITSTVLKIFNIL